MKYDLNYEDKKPTRFYLIKILITQYSNKNCLASLASLASHIKINNPNQEVDLISMSSSHPDELVDQLSIVETIIPN